jgi:drug/metabolite transporter (DMT)-like permease
MQSHPLRTATWVALALCGFAANSLLCRVALDSTGIDPASFTVVRLVSGALVLTLLCLPLRAGSPWSEGDWRGALALLVYAVAFAYAYLALHAGVGALLLFGAVQVTMIGGGLRRGERLGPRQWSGVVLALAGLAAMKLPWGGVALPMTAVAAMLVAGVAWGVYSLLGRGARAPLALTAGNFVRAALLAAPLPWLVPHPVAMPFEGVLLGIASGALASGIGYALWYAALPALRATQAALLQLLVPVLTAGVGVMWLSEPLDARLGWGGTLILGGVALALVRR